MTIATAWPGRARRVRAGARSALGDLLGLVLPVECAGCGAPDVPWCPACAELLAGPPWRCEQRAGRLDRLDGSVVPAWTLAECAGALRQAVVAWKDRGRRDLSGVFAASLARAAARAAPFVPTHAGAVLVVAVPSTGAARRRRGGNLVDVLAVAVADGLARGGLDARMVDALRRRRGADQVGLGSRARARNLAGRVRVRAVARDELAGVDVVVVDDVLTTGASIAACRAAMEAAGARVVAAFTLGATPPPGARTRGATTRSSRPPPPGPPGTPRLAGGGT